MGRANNPKPWAIGPTDLLVVVQPFELYCDGGYKLFFEPGEMILVIKAGRSQSSQQFTCLIRGTVVDFHWTWRPEALGHGCNMDSFLDVVSVQHA